MENIEEIINEYLKGNISVTVITESITVILVTVTDSRSQFK